MRLVHDNTSYQGGIDLDPTGYPDATLDVSSDHGTCTLRVVAKNESVHINMPIAMSVEDMRELAVAMTLATTAGVNYLQSVRDADGVA